MESALVTGGAGFLGSHVAEHLVRAGLRVVVLDDMSRGFRRSVPSGCDFCQGSILDDRLVDALFAQHRFDYVFHLAAYAAEVLSHYVRRFNYANNLIGSVNLINAAVQYRATCFVFASSIAVYGDAALPHTEDAVPSPIDPYGIAKLAVELDLRAARELFGLRYVVFRPHNVYGERQNLADPYRNVIAIFMKQVREGRPCTVFGDGSQTRAFTHVDDVAPIITRSIRVPDALDRVFNVGTDVTCTVRELASRVQQKLGREVGIRYLPARNERAHVWADHTRLDRVFGVREPVDLDEGLRRMAAWAGTVETPRAGRLTGVEVQWELPPSWARRDRVGKL